ncbi:MAG TPA: glycosyltransferase [Rhodospirillales bacterium]|nr:glycosyltransferase [Rhodospirillales bacterium]
MSRRLKVLVSAYACEPGKGSEPGVGWNFAVHMAKHHDVWVLTRANNRSVIEAALAERPVPGLRFAYYDLPDWARFWKRGQRGVPLYYYLWQLGALRVARRLHAEIGFDRAQHVTFVCYWKPSFLPFLGVPYVLGPVGGGESAPRSFWPGLGLRGFFYELFRETARWLDERDPLVRLAIRRADLVLATTDETAVRVRRLGGKVVECVSQVALPEDELAALARLPNAPTNSFRFLSIGRLLAWKGFHLGIAAFAKAGLEEAEYWIIGDGPERRRLERLARRLGVADRVCFLGHLPRREVMQRLGECHVLVHPSLHDSGGWVCLEAMAAGRPVICLDLGGPATQVTEETGIRVTADRPVQAIRGLGEAMRRLAVDPALCARMGEAARRRTCDEFRWLERVRAFEREYGPTRGRRCEPEPSPHL